MEPSWMEVKEEMDLESPFRFEGLRGKVRFSFAEIKVLLEEVKNHRFVVLKKFNAGVSSETKKQTWSEITDKVNSLGVTVREVRQIMKKWADLKCDARRRMLAMRAPKGHKKTLGPVEVMVQKILLLAPGKDEAELDIGSIEEISPRRPRAKPRGRPRRHSLSSPKEEPVEEFYQSSPEMNFDLIHDETMPLDFEEQDELLPTVKHSYSSSPSYAPFPLPPPSPYPSSSNGTASFHPSPSSSSSVMPPPLLLPPPPPPPRHVPPPPPPSSSSSSSSSLAPPPARLPSPPRGGARERLARVAAQSLQQQQVSGALLGSVSRSLELLASAVQQLVETQQDFITESLGQQRHTLDILKDFSHNALTLLRDRPPAHAKHPPSHTPGPPSGPPSGLPSGPPSAPTTSTLPASGPEPEPAPGPEVPTGPEQHNLEPQDNETQKVDLQKPPMDHPEPQEPGLRDPEPQEPGLRDPEPQEPGIRDPEPQEPGLSDPEPQTPQPMEVQDTQPRIPGEPKPGSPDPDGPDGP